jgi:hypothetical protein
MNSDLLNELRTARQAQTAAHAKWVKAREAANDAWLDERAAHEEYERAAAVVEGTERELLAVRRQVRLRPSDRRAVVEETERELLTGETGLPLFGRANGNGADHPPDVPRIIDPNLLELANGWTVAKLAEVIFTFEGPLGDGTKTVLCRHCGTARPAALLICRNCLDTETVPVNEALPYVAAAEPEPGRPRKAVGT